MSSIKTGIIGAGNMSKEHLNVIKAIDENSPISHFIDKKGGGMHHIALIVDNIQATLDYLINKDIQLIDNKPRIGAEGFKIAFLHPKSTGGVLIELCEKEDQ